jgi:hypothetical protein
MKIDNLWILNKDRLVLFQQAQLGKIGGQSFGYFISAIYTFAKQIYDKGMQGFELGNTIYFCKRDQDLLFIANTTNNTNRRDTYIELEKVAKLFFETYPSSEISKWRGDILVFQDFAKKIQEKLLK